MSGEKRGEKRNKKSVEVRGDRTATVNGALADPRAAGHQRASKGPLRTSPVRSSFVFTDARKDRSTDVLTPDSHGILCFR